MQAMPDARQQSFEEIYGPPEHFLEIEVTLYLRHLPTFTSYTRVLTFQLRSRTHRPTAPPHGPCTHPTRSTRAPTSPLSSCVTRSFVAATLTLNTSAIYLSERAPG